MSEYRYIAKLMSEEGDLIIGDYDGVDPRLAGSLINRTRIIRVFMYVHSLGWTLGLDYMTPAETIPDHAFAAMLFKALEHVKYPPGQISNNDITSWLRRKKTKVTLIEEAYIPN